MNRLPFSEKNAEIAASGTWLLEFEDELFIKKYLPLNFLKVNNTSNYPIEVRFNASTEKKVMLAKGESLISGIPFYNLAIINLDTGNVIPVDKIFVTYNLVPGMEPTVSVSGGGSSVIEGSVEITSALPAGSNNIGDVDIASALPAGSNNIGDVDVLTLPVNEDMPVHIAASATIKASAGSVSAISVISDGTNAATLILRDGGAAGTIVWKIAGGTVGAGLSFPQALTFSTDIYAELVGTGAEASVAYA